MKTAKILSIILALMLVLTTVSALSSCDVNDGKYTIGICQLVTHPALDAATKGFQDAIIEELGAENVTFDYQNAGNSSTTCSTIVSSFAAKNVDLIMANATPALQAATAATKTIPILGTSITEYGVALGIDNFSGTVGGNVSGTSDLADLEAQAQMIIDLVPDAKNIGLLYCTAEPNSKYQVDTVKAYLEGKGIIVKDYGFATINDVTSITQKASSECDAIYIPTDNTAASCAETIYNAMGTKKPIIAGEAGICGGCGIATLSISYYDLGYKTGEMAVEILKNGADISTMEIQYAPYSKQYNPAICEELGIDVEALKAAGYVALS